MALTAPALQIHPNGASSIYFADYLWSVRKHPQRTPREITEPWQNGHMFTELGRHSEPGVIECGRDFIQESDINITEKAVSDLKGNTIVASYRVLARTVNVQGLYVLNAYMKFPYKPTSGIATGGLVNGNFWADFVIEVIYYFPTVSN